MRYFSKQNLPKHGVPCGWQSGRMLWEPQLGGQRSTQWAQPISRKETRETAAQRRSNEGPDPKHADSVTGLLG